MSFALLHQGPRGRKSKPFPGSWRLPLTRIGKIGKGNGLVVRDATGETVTLDTMGYDHFRT